MAMTAPDRLSSRSGGLARCATLVLMALLLSACQSVAYYGQAVRGHFALLLQREPVEDVLRRDGVDPTVRNGLEQAVRAREFAARYLALEDRGSYHHYVELDRPFVLWNVFAAPVDAVRLEQWCYPVAGCAGYRGYFSRQQAESAARRIAADGLDVYVGGVAAYSTLGWFRDPLTTPMLRRPGWAVVALVFHELAHQRVWLPGDTEFNESYATFVEREGLRRWVEDGTGEAGVLQSWQKARMRQQEFESLVTRYTERLRELYDTVDSADARESGRQRIRESMRREYRRLSDCWGVDAYAGWFEGPLNNAQLATVGTYSRWVPAFRALLREAGGDAARFHSMVEALAGLPAGERRERLRQLSERSSDFSLTAPASATRCGPASS